ncbi:hypothetical protein [Calothrix sp. UHCC 0171]|uniref:hypothetical protein n=1 Tax=Calothrix sp. UHCC 0171 TaxID=3110245 RepID=UPI002B20B7BD|nr:hypothetical protein [Calothrix sp. UHCC 0171]MEA5570163.1 hypothetical protein [Calothrix sp. UHCC 0171]
MIDKLNNSIEQIKDSFAQALQVAEQMKQSTSVAIQASVSSPLNDLLLQHPALVQTLKFIGWMLNHPIRGVFIILLVIAIIWSIIRAIVRLIEAASLSILKTPLKLIWLFMKNIGKLFSNFTITSWTKSQDIRNRGIPSLGDINSELTENNQCNHQCQRLVEISSRLAEIQREQNTLLQEASELIISGKLDNNFLK